MRVYVVSEAADEDRDRLDRGITGFFLRLERGFL